MDRTGYCAASTTIECLPREIIEHIFNWLTPQSIKRFGQTCKPFNTIASEYQTSRGYANFLGRSAVKFLPHIITGAEKALEMRNNIKTDILSLISLAVVRCPKNPVSRWSTTELVRFLYPLSISLSIWPESVYAFEWCVNCSDEHFQQELKPLLLPDAFERLKALDAERFPSFGIRDCLHHDARKLIYSYMSNLPCNGNGVLMLAVLAASDAYDIYLEPIGAYQGIAENTKIPIAELSPIRKKLKRVFNFAKLIFSTKNFPLSKREVDWFRQIGVTIQFQGHILSLPES
jgi:hypothetical protein